MTKYDLSTQRGKTVAVKNAHRLLSKRSFSMAAGVFLLAGKVKDGLGVLRDRCGADVAWLGCR